MFHVAHVYARVRNATTGNGRGGWLAVKKTGWQWKLLTFRSASFIYYCAAVYTQTPPQSRPHRTRLYSTTASTATSLCAPRESEWVVGRRTADDLRSRAANPNNFSKLSRRPYDYNAGNSSLGPRTLTHSCVFLRVYTIVNHLQLSSDRFTGLRYYILLLYLLGHRPVPDKRLRDSVFLSLLLYTYINIIHLPRDKRIHTKFFLRWFRETYTQFVSIPLRVQML